MKTKGLRLKGFYQNATGPVSRFYPEPTKMVWLYLIDSKDG